MPDPTASLLDNFNRANEGPPPSSSWTNGILTFVGGEGLIVTSNECGRLSTGGFRQGSYWNAATFGPDVCVIADVTGWVDTEGNSLALFGRLVNIGAGATDGYTVMFERAASATEVWVWRVDNAALTALGSVSTVTLAAGDKVAIQVIGSAIEGWHKSGAGAWTRVRNETDSTYTAAGRVGCEITLAATPDIKIDNFSAVTISSQARPFVNHTIA